MIKNSIGDHNTFDQLSQIHSDPKKSNIYKY